MIREERLDDREESLRLAFESVVAQVWTSIPGIITSVNLTDQTVSVQPSIQGVISDSAGNAINVNLPILTDVPIVWPRGGGFALTFPIKAGDEVLVVFSSRCIDSWWQSGGIGVPMEARMHDLSDGFAILAPTSQPKRLSGVNPTNAQLRTESGNTYLEITPTGKVKIVATTEIEMIAPAIKMTGTVTVTGDVTASGVTVGGVALGSHRHIDPQGGTTGPPIN